MNGIRGTTGLFEEILAAGNDLVVRVTGPSMAPTLRSGDAVVLRKADPQAVRPGDLVFHQPASGPPMLHRLIGRKATGDGRLLFRTMGDALCTADPPFGGEALLAVAVAVHRPLASGGEEVIPLRSTSMRIRGRITALLAAAGFRRLRRPRGPLTPPGRR